MSCREHRPGGRASQGRMEQSERGSGISQYHGCLPHERTVAATRGTWGCIPACGPCSACVLTCRDQASNRLSARLGTQYPVFRPQHARPAGAHQNPSSGGGGTLCLITASTSPPAAVRDIATSFSFKRGFSSLDWIYRLAVPQERVSFPDLSSWAPRPRRAYRARICSALRWTPVARTLRHSITGLVMLVVVLLRSDEATCELAARRLGRRLD